MAKIKMPESLVGFVFFIPYREDLEVEQFDGVTEAMQKVPGVQSVGEAMGARPFHLVEFHMPDDGKVDLFKVERQLMAARDSILANSKYCRACEGWTLHKKYPLDFKCEVCGEWFYGDGQDMTQAEWDAKYNPEKVAA